MNIEKFQCPNCGKEISADPELSCSTCQKQFREKDGVFSFFGQDLRFATEINYWNEKQNTEEHLYENLAESAFTELLDWFNIPENSDGLELGCGDAPFARRLQQKNCNLFGVDVSMPLLKIASKSLIAIQCDAEALPFKDHSFDWIIYAFALHHMPNHAKALKESIRVLKPKGRLYLVEPNYYHPVRYLTRHPDQFLRKRVFKNLSPEESWVSLKTVKDLYSHESVTVEDEKYFTPKFVGRNSKVGKLQDLIGKLCASTPLAKFTQSYYFVKAQKA